MSFSYASCIAFPLFRMYFIAILPNLPPTPLSACNLLYIQRCAVSLPRRRARAKNPKKAENSEIAMHKGDSVVCFCTPTPFRLAAL